MEGVIVTAKKDGSNISISVITDDKGKYAFPASKVDTGKYTISIRAAGYELDGSKAVEVKDGGAPNDIKLKPSGGATLRIKWLDFQSFACEEALLLSKVNER